MNTILSDLNNTSTGIEASAIISADGLVIAAALPEGMDEDSVGAMSAALLSVSSRSSLELVNSALEQIVVKGKQGYILITHVCKDVILTVITQSHKELEPIISEIKHSSEKISAHLNR
ncbi:MAG: roadblock/LC7 domain-containing protein [Methylovulum sp.]|nr:roadblock/LC7 domain-containing protein [Methylovulum sp.]